MLDDIKKSMGTDGRTRGLGKKIVAFVCFGLIILVFVFMDMGSSQLGAGGGGVVGQVNNVTISLADFRTQVEQMERQFGGNSNPQFSSFIRNRALESLIDQELLFQKSQDVGIIISDDEIRDVIFNLPYFQENGRFQPARYESVLRANRLSVGQFESNIRKEAATGRLRRLIAMSLVPSKGELERQQLSESKKAKVEFLSFTEKSISAKMKSQIKKPEIVDAELKKEAEAFFSTIISEFSTKEQVQARHILIKTDKRTDAEAKKKIEEVAKQLNPKNFADMAIKHSEDIGSGKKGGDLGFFTRGRMVKPFEDQAFSMQEGTISKPVKSQFGYHVIYLVKKQPASTKKYEEVEDEVVRRLLAKKKAKEVIAELEKKLKAGETSASEQFRKTYGLKWQETSEFALGSESVPSIGRSDELIESAFKLSDKAIAPQFFRISGQTFIIKGKSVAVSKDPSRPDDELHEQLSQVQANDAFSRLRDQWRSQAVIERNEAFLKSIN